MYFDLSNYSGKIRTRACKIDEFYKSRKIPFITPTIYLPIFCYFVYLIHGWLTLQILQEFMRLYYLHDLVSGIKAACFMPAFLAK